MKAIMLSIQPKYCELIASGKKTVEVRKTAPKLQTPFKCYIYCTGGVGKEVIKNIAYRWNGTRLIKRHVDKGWLKDNPEQTWQILLDYGFTHPIHKGDYELNGKVIGEFICDKIYEIRNLGSRFMIGDDIALTNRIAKESCLQFDEMKKYLRDKDGYAWHITDLKIYDKPKELGEFRRQNSCYKSGNIDELGCWEGGCTFHDLGECDGRCSTLTRPPQSWCYVEELSE